MNEREKLVKKIEILRRITVERGASQNEEEIAKEKIVLLEKRLIELAPKVKHEEVPPPGYTMTGSKVTGVFIYPQGKVKKDVNFTETWKNNMKEWYAEYGMAEQQADVEDIDKEWFDFMVNSDQ